MNIHTESTHAGGFLLSEGNGSISRERIVLPAGPLLQAGQLLAKNGAKYAPYVDKATSPAVAVLYDRVPESDADRQGAAVVRLAEVKGAELIGLDVDALDGLITSQIIVR